MSPAPLPGSATLATFSALPDEARLWLMAFARPMEEAALAPPIQELLGWWRHKGTHYEATWALIEGRILAIAEPTLATQPSGCAIDGMLRGVNQIALRLGAALEDPLAVIVRQADGIQAIPRADLEAWLADGRLDGATPILDLGLLTLGELRAGRFARPLATTWIGRKYKIQAPAITGA